MLISLFFSPSLDRPFQVNKPIINTIHNFSYNHQSINEKLKVELESEKKNTAPRQVE